MTLSDGREPSLYDAKARVERAREHIKSLERQIAGYGWAGPMHPSIKTASIGFPPSAICSILVGEIAYNLKAALDYLVFELFYLATGKLHNGTKFLIVDTPKEWERNFPQTDTPPKVLKKLWIHHLRAEHQAILKELQPFNRTEWTKTLQKITNPDRHRQLIELAGEIGYVQLERLSPERAATIAATGFPNQMFVHFETTREVRLHRIEGDAVGTMQNRADHVAKVIERFELDFQGEVAGSAIISHNITYTQN
jgi:hypothetical protein